MANFSVILAGGSGTRLWPLSRKNFPKQFLTLYGDHSLLQHTFLRIMRVTPEEHVYIVTGIEHKYNVLNQIREIVPSFPEDRIIIEPEGRNTFPAIVLALRYLEEIAGAKKDDTVLFTPADAYVADEAGYARTLHIAQQHAQNGLIVVGVTPTSPEVGYGYIEVGAKEGAVHRVHSFHEKPDEAKAKKFLSSGKYLWNAGIYVGTLGVFLDEIKRQQSGAYLLYTAGLQTLRTHAQFMTLPALSIDYALTEGAEDVFVTISTFGWSDVGSFDALATLFEERGDRYAKHVGVDSKDVFVHSASDRLVVTLGVDDLVVVDQHDSLLIHKKGRSAEVGAVLKLLKEAGHKEVEHNLLVHRPWGKYEVLIDTPTYKVKKILVYPGAKLSLQSHQHRAEHWVVVAGIAAATVGENVITLKQNESAFIAAGQTHRLANPATQNLEIVEVQTGSYLGEDDIQRYEDTYQRV